MGSTAGKADSFSCPNYVGELFQVGGKRTPFLNMIGGLGGQGKVAKSFDYAMSAKWSLDDGSQPGIDEDSAMTAPTATHYAREQEVNTCQIHQKKVAVSYMKLAQSALIAGLPLQEPVHETPNELDIQIAAHLGQVAADVNWVFLNGEYQKATASNVAAKTGGIVTGCTTNVVDAAGAEFSSLMLNNLLTLMSGNAEFGNMAIWANAYVRSKISDQYGLAIRDQTVGGVSVSTLLTDFASVRVAWDPNMPTDVLLVADMSKISPVFCAVPADRQGENPKGYLFYEQLAKSGAGSLGHIYGQIGLDYGTELYHGKIINLKDA